MSVNRVNLVTPSADVNPSGATGQVKTVGWLGRSISVDYGGNEIKLNRGSLIDFLNAQGADLKKGGYFWGGSSNQDILEAFNNVKEVKPAVFALARNLKTANEFTSLNNVTLRNSYERKIILKEYIKIKWPKGPTAAELNKAFESIKSDLGYNLSDPGDLLNEIADCCNLAWVPEQLGEKEWAVHFVKPEVSALLFGIKNGNISSLKGQQLTNLDTNECRLVYKEFLKMRGPESSNYSIDPTERRNILKEYIEMKFPEGPTADDLNKAFGSILKELDNKYDPAVLANDIADCFTNLTYSEGPRGEINFLNRSRSVS